MADAPALPAQTPGVFIGGGGAGSSLSGECAAAVADAGLSSVDFGTLESVTESVEAAAGRCQDYQEARWLEEVEREFETAAAGGSENEGERARLRRRPTPRQRHLKQCVAAPLLDPRFFRSNIWDPSTNTPAGPGQSPPGAAGYDPLRALSSPTYRGPTMVTAVLAVVSKLDPPLVAHSPAEGARNRTPGTALSEEETTAALRLAIRGVLAAAAHEDRPRLRSVELSQHRRPRQEESEQREAERARPEAPALAETAQPEASGVDPSADEGADAPDSDTGHSAGGCVEAQSASSVAAMREEIHEQCASVDGDAEDATGQEELAARRSESRASIEVQSREGEARAAEGAEPLTYARAQASRRRAGTAFASAIAARTVASARWAAIPAMGEQAFLLEQNGQVGSAGISGQVPALGTPTQAPSSKRIFVVDG
ncbi:MAG: hypothetical protein KC619_22775 [Myxococcales bacterium]|nr:hypothetical protein [Myxococcales bacterium]